MRYIPITEKDKQEMLEAARASSIGELFSDVPKHLLFSHELDLPNTLTEREARTALEKLANKNTDPRGSVSFLGAGAYEHFVPSLVHQVLLQPGFLKPYTPYHGEPSQGILQALFEYQTLIAQLTGMEIANASLYEGGTALAEAVYMARRIKKPRRVDEKTKTHATRICVSRAVNPMYRDVLETYAEPAGLITTELAVDSSAGTTSFMERFAPNEVAAVVVQYPNFFGVVEDLREARAYADKLDALLIVVVTEPVALGILEPPGTFGADIVVGEGQSLGCPLGFGGPYLGLFATKKEYVREMPGRLIGKTKEAHGDKDGYIVTFSTREQHIRREKATSNICTNEALLCVGSSVWMSLYGKEGLRELALHNLAKARYAKDCIARLSEFKIMFSGYAFNEFVVSSKDYDVEILLKKLAHANVFGGVRLDRRYPALGNAFLVCVTEMRTKEEIDAFADALKTITSSIEYAGPLYVLGTPMPPSVSAPVKSAKKKTGTALPGLVFKEPLIFERSSEGKRGVDLPRLDVPWQPLPKLFPKRFIREEIEGFPEVSEPEVAKHFARLAALNISIETATMYPLGSCTMKDNPRFHEDIARLPGFAALHPLVPASHAQGSLEVMWHLEQMLKEISGMHAATLLPAAGAHGEQTGLMMIRKALIARGEKRTKILIPDSAHGTNPASAALCGFTPIAVKSDADGRVRAETVRQLMDEDVAGIMMTNPNTLGLFESEIEHIARIVHEKGGYVYCDGANMNAIVGVTRPGDWGADVLQMNLHKTFSTPHGGGGPGSGPVGVSSKLEPFLPDPRVEKQIDERGKEAFVLTMHGSKQGIGAIRTFQGNFLVCLRAYAYILSYGKEHLREIAETSVLSANYILARLRGTYDAPRNPLGAPCKHECVLNDAQQLPYGVTTRDIAKRLMDYGFHPPTIYFPLIVPGALMIEPTETASKDEIDAFIDAMIAIALEAKENKDAVLSAPHRTPVGRLEESIGLAELVLRYENK